MSKKRRAEIISEVKGNFPKDVLLPLPIHKIVESYRSGLRLISLGNQIHEIKFDAKLRRPVCDLLSPVSGTSPTGGLRDVPVVVLPWSRALLPVFMKEQRDTLFKRLKESNITPAVDKDDTHVLVEWLRACDAFETFVLNKAANVMGTSSPSSHGKNHVTLWAVIFQFFVNEWATATAWNDPSLLLDTTRLNLHWESFYRTRCVVSFETKLNEVELPMALQLLMYCCASPKCQAGGLPFFCESCGTKVGGAEASPLGAAKSKHKQVEPESYFKTLAKDQNRITPRGAESMC